MNLGANVLEALACRWSEFVRRWEGTELYDADGE